MGEANNISFDISGDDVVEVRASPAMEAAKNLEAYKAAGAALAGKKDWKGALDEYEKAVVAYDACKETLSCDFEAERIGEKVMLASLSNQSLCSLKLENFEEAKRLASLCVKRLKEARVIDESAVAKCLFRKGQASLGLGDARGAVDFLAEAVRLEEKVLETSQAANQKQKAAGVVAMKRELVKARKVAREEAKAASSKMKGMSGFLKAGAKGIADPKVERAELIVAKIDCALSYVFSDKDVKGKDAEPAASIPPNYDAMISALVDARHGACAAKDVWSELALTFAEGFVAFLASAPEAEASAGRAKYYVRSSDAMASYWHLREELSQDTADQSRLEPPCAIGDVAALECAAHAYMQLGRYGDALPYFEKYVELADAAGPLMAYHNLPDSFLLSRGMPKMDDKARRVSRWKHRAHSPRALFDAKTALSAIYVELKKKAEALAVAEAAMAHAADDDEKLTVHKNLAYVLRRPTPSPTDDDPDREEPPSDADLALALQHDERAAALEAEIKKKGEAPSEVNKLKVAADALDGEDDAEDDAPVPEEDLEDDAAPDEDGDVDVPLADQ